jgi:hypothetical protein
MEEILMKKASVTMGLVAGLVALLVASGAKAQDITIAWKVTDHNISNGYLPKVASDGLNTVAIIDMSSGGFAFPVFPPILPISAFQYQIGDIEQASVLWAGAPMDLYGPTLQIGHGPSIALAYETGFPNCDDAIEVHQGGQDKDGSLWYQLGKNCAKFKDIHWADAVRYGIGYNATVAADLISTQVKKDPTVTVVEVHQEANGESNLDYTVGALALGHSPAITWGKTTAITESTGNGGATVQGALPTVSVANNFVVLVFEGTDGALMYSTGLVDTTTSTIAWNAPVMYGNGYDPTVSVFGDGTTTFGISEPWVVVEAHQVASGPAPLLNGGVSLVSNTGFLTGSTSPITWSAPMNIPYATGCNPSVALFFNNEFQATNVSLAETHETECDITSSVDYGFGDLLVSE